MQPIIDQARELIADLAPGVTTQLEERTGFTLVRLAPPLSADYSFQLYVYDDGESQICAELLEGGDFTAFWYWPFEIQEFRSQQAQWQAFLQGVHSVLSCPTRISRKSGLVFHTFRCEAREGASWRRLGPSMGFLRWGHRAPPGHSWQSPPLSSSTRAA
jgi:hypothetical protein